MTAERVVWGLVSFVSAARTRRQPVHSVDTPVYFIEEGVLWQLWVTNDHNRDLFASVGCVGIIWHSDF